MKKKIAACGAAFLLLASMLLVPSVRVKASAAYTTIINMAILNSKIDATPIGQTTPSNGTFTTVNGNSNLPTSNYYSQGSYLSFNLSGGQGETEFINSRGEGSGGFRWYAATTSSIGSPIMTLSNGGALSSTGGYSGNASTATALAADPSDCSSPQYSRGINASGTANCSQPAVSEISGFPSFTGTSGYQVLTPTGSFSVAWATGSSVSADSVQNVSLPHTFPNACLSAWTVNLDPSQTTNVTKNWAVVSCTTSTVTVELQRRGDEGSFSAQPRVFAFGY